MTAAEAGTKATFERTGEREGKAERIFNAPRDLVWRAFTEAELVAQWWGRGNRLDVVRDEFERGGHWRYVEHSDGEQHGFEGRYREIVPQERIERTFEWDGMPGHVVIETALFEDLGDGRTKVTSISSFYAAEELEGMAAQGMEEGMNASYAALDRLLERLQA
jgi:uncharacterized protein YndB with AHSA1/START domain